MPSYWYKTTPLSTKNTEKLNTSFGDISSSEEAIETQRSNLHSIMASAPSYLRKITTILQIDLLNLGGLLDIGASENSMSDQGAKTVKLQIQEKRSRISMAFNNMTARVLGTVCSDVHVQGRGYSNVKLRVMQKLCDVIILGKDVLNRHEK